MNENRQQKIIDLQQRLATAGVVFGVRNSLKQPSASSEIHHDFPPDFPVDLVQMAVLNEISTTTYGDISSYGFALMILRQIAMAQDEKFLWCMAGRQPLESGQLFALGLSAIGIDPAKIIQLEVRRTIDVLWAMEEAARSGALKAVVGIIDNLTFTQSRRLSLAAARGQTPVFMLRPYNNDGASTAFSRWRLSSRPGQVNIYNPRTPSGIQGPGRAAFEVELYQCRDGRRGKWVCHYENQKHQTAHRLSVVATTGNRTPVSHFPQRAKKRNR